MMRLAPVLLLVTLGVGWTAEGAATPQAVADRGIKAMKDSFERPAAIVDAAISFDEARKLYQAQADTEHVCEMQAYIFWCKRRMNLDDLRAFLGQKNEDKLQKAMAAVDAVANQTVPPSEAQAYFDRAHTYADQHPDHHLEIAIRYFEVAERFQGSDVSLKAQRLSLDEQQKHLAAIKDATASTPPVAATTAPAPTPAAPAVDTLFSRKAAPDGARAAIPASDAVRAATAQIKQTYKTDYARTKRSQHRTLAAKLLAQARATRDDVAMRWALLGEARDQAIGSDDAFGACAAIDAAAELFDGVDAAAQKKSALGRIKSPVASSMQRLIADPANADANATVGKYLCFELARWDDGVRLLANGSDKELKHAAEMEVANPADGARIAEVADAWFKLAGKEKGDDQIALLLHAAALYLRCQPQLSGMTLEVATKRVDDILGALPDERLDPAVMTTKRWDAIKAKMIKVPADKDRIDSNLVLAAGQVAHLLLKPGWTWRAGDDWSDSHGKGQPVNGLRPGEMVWSIDLGPRQSIWSGPVCGEGHLMLGANRAKDGGKGGDIGVKIVVVNDDD